MRSAATHVVALFLVLTLPGCASHRLATAIKDDDVSAARQLLERHADIDGKSEDGSPIIFNAIFAKHDDILLLLLDHGAKVDTVDHNGVTPLVLAARRGTTDVASILLAHGADPNHRTRLAETPLLAAVTNDRPDIVRLLLRAGAQPDSGDPTGITPLMLAAQTGNIELMQQLIAAGADANRSAATGMTPLMFAAYRPGSDKIEPLQVLLKAGADINKRSPDGATAIGQAALGGNPTLALWLLSSGADPDVPETQSAMRGRLQHILGDYLLSKGRLADARNAFRSAHDSYYATAERLSAEVAQLELKEALLELVQSAAIVASYASAVYQAQAYQRQLAQIEALRRAAHDGTGPAGYSQYLSQYNRAYIPSYVVAGFVPIPAPPPNAAIVDVRRYVEAERDQYRGLEQLTGRMLVCLNAVDVKQFSDCLGTIFAGAALGG